MTVAVVAGGCVTVVTAMRGCLDEACVTQQPMTTQMTIEITKSMIPATVAPATVPPILAVERGRIFIHNLECHFGLIKYVDYYIR